MPYIAEKNLEKCRQCGFCDEIACGSRYVGYYEECTGCGACSLACHYEAIQMIEIPNGKSISIKVDGAIISVPDRVTVKKALEMCGYELCDSKKTCSWLDGTCRWRCWHSVAFEKIIWFHRNGLLYLWM